MTGRPSWASLNIETKHIQLRKLRCGTTRKVTAAPSRAKKREKGGNNRPAGPRPGKEIKKGEGVNHDMLEGRSRKRNHWPKDRKTEGNVENCCRAEKLLTSRTARRRRKIKSSVDAVKKF